MKHVRAVGLHHETNDCSFAVPRRHHPGLHPPSHHWNHCLHLSRTGTNNFSHVPVKYVAIMKSQFGRIA